MFLTQTVSLLVDAMLNVAYPRQCVLCKSSVESRSLGVACQSCWDATSVFDGEETMCWKCGIPSPALVAPDVREAVRCRRCDEQSFTAARACGFYEGALRVSALALKRQPYLAHHLLDLLVVQCRRKPLNQSSRLIPVPLHRERQRLRGFNQAAVIGQALAQVVKLPLDEVSLVRNAQSEKYRAGLDAKGRHDTVENAFSVRHPRLVTGETILLIDDVFTTGATVHSCASVLIAAGAREVFVLTIARPSPY